VVCSAHKIRKEVNEMITDRQAIMDYLKAKQEEEMEESELTKQVREHRLSQFRPVVIVRKKDGREYRKEMR
jgi:hypothetical protein